MIVRADVSSVHEVIARQPALSRDLARVPPLKERGIDLAKPFAERAKSVLGLDPDGTVVGFDGFHHRDGLDEALAALPKTATDEQIRAAHREKVVLGGMRYVFPIVEPGRRDDWARLGKELDRSLTVAWRADSRAIGRRLAAKMKQIGVGYQDYSIDITKQMVMSAPSEHAVALDVLEGAVLGPFDNATLDQRAELFARYHQPFATGAAKSERSPWTTDCLEDDAPLVICFDATRTIDADFVDEVARVPYQAPALEQRMTHYQSAVSRRTLLREHRDFDELRVRYLLRGDGIELEYRWRVTEGSLPIVSKVFAKPVQVRSSQQRIAKIFAPIRRQVPAWDGPALHPAALSPKSLHRLATRLTTSPEAIGGWLSLAATQASRKLKVDNAAAVELPQQWRLQGQELVMTMPLPDAVEP